jgi:hypothetical protein
MALKGDRFNLRGSGVAPMVFQIDESLGTLDDHDSELTGLVWNGPLLCNQL